LKKKKNQSSQRAKGFGKFSRTKKEQRKASTTEKKTSKAELVRWQKMINIIN
jgi:hypothetical protein